MHYLRFLTTTIGFEAHGIGCFTYLIYWFEGNLIKPWLALISPAATGRPEAPLLGWFVIVAHAVADASYEAQTVMGEDAIAICNLGNGIVLRRSQIAHEGGLRDCLKQLSLLRSRVLAVAF